jgi:hypothetical protein
MKKFYGMFGRCFRVSLLLAFMGSCATVPELKVNYQLPASSDRMKGWKVCLSVEDERTEREFLGSGAKKEFEVFSGHIAFSIARYKEKGFKAGVFGVSDVMKEGFKRKLENLGFTVLFDPSPGVPRLQIVLNEFFLDLVDRQWVATMSYEARVVEGREVLAMQSISGQAERYKLVSLEGADKVMGEIFTDTVNRLDVHRLFKQAGLI